MGLPPSHTGIEGEKKLFSLQSTNLQVIWMKFVISSYLSCVIKWLLHRGTGCFVWQFSKVRAHVSQVQVKYDDQNKHGQVSSPRSWANP